MAQRKDGAIPMIFAKNLNMKAPSDPVYDKYIAQFRVLIETHGAQNAIHALAEAFRLESEDSTHQERQNQYLKAAAEETGKLYYEIEKL